jgi:uncharacterized protein
VLTVLVLVAMLIGLVGTVVPLVPGLVLIAGAAVVHGLVDGFGGVGTAAIAVILALGVAATVAGVVIPQRAAGSAGATRTSLVLGIAGAVIGFFVIPVVGMPVGGALGIYLGERLRTADHDVAWAATVATLKGYGAGALVQLAAGVLMILVWGAWVIAR